MRNIVNENVQNFIEEHIKYSEGLKFEMEEYAKKNSIPIITKDTLNLLKTILLLKKPKKILEFGTAIGYSSIQIIDILGGDCEITTIERDEDRFKEAEKNIKKSGYNEQIRLIKGDAIEIDKYLDRNYDFIFIDAAKGQYKKFFDKIINNVTEKALIVSDNIFYNTLVCKPDINSVERRQRTIYRRMNDYLDFLTKTEGFFTSLVPIGDGLAITILNGENYNEKSRVISTGR
ncbi:MAG: O-methyltransferase [Filifactoraceae bacterium]